MSKAERLLFWENVLFKNEIAIERNERMIGPHAGYWFVKDRMRVLSDLRAKNRLIRAKISEIKGGIESGPKIRLS